MTTHPRDEHDVTKVYSGPVLSVELYQQALREAGIASNVVGLDLAASFGTAIADSVELWVNGADADRAVAVIRRFEAESGAKA